MKRIILVVWLLFIFVLCAGYNLDCYSFPNAEAPLLIPTYVEDNDETCHPDVLYFPEGWNGWQYWMSHTPYPNSNVAHENPSIVVSNDGISWVEPAGISNPVADVYQGTDMNNNYNSDSHLFMYPEGTMNLIWRRKNGWNNELTYLKSSTDGITWSQTRTILSVLGTNPALNESTLSPCLVHNGSKFMLWTVNTKVNPRGIYLRLADDYSFNWSDPILTDIGEFPEGYRVWHMDVEYIDGYYHMLAAVGIPTTQEGRVLYLGKSLDGVHWSFSSQPVMTGVQGSWDVRLYRPAFLRDGIGYKNWYGSQSPPQWKIGYSEAQINGYLEGPQNFHVEHSYDGHNHYNLNLEAPNPDVTGYKVYVNYELSATLEASQNQYNITVQEGAQFDDRVVLAVTALYNAGESDPVVARMGLALSNPQSPGLLDDGMLLYPNPFKDILWIESKAPADGIFKLFNSRGQLLDTRKIRAQEQISLDAKLPNGIYFCILESGDGQRQVKKVLRLK
jgi:hypothetical protein